VVRWKTENVAQLPSWKGTLVGEGFQLADAA